jgi:flavorubredoxin
VNYYEIIAKCLPEGDKITIVYDSMYGSVEKAIVHTIKRLEELGMKYIAFKFTDLQHSSISEILSEIADCKALIIGVSTYENDLFPYIDYLLDLMVKKIRIGKPILLISSYGWSRIASVKLREKLSETNFKIFESIEFQGQPSSTDLQKIDESITRLINSIK